MVAKGNFRSDLYFRLSEATVRLPSLRERPEDVALLVRHMMGQSWGDQVVVDPKAMAVLEQHTWPGNVRELRNVLRRLHASLTGQYLSPEAVESVLAPASTRSPSDEEATRILTGTSLPIARARDAYRKAYLTRLIEEHGDDHGAIANHMGVHIKYARRLMRRHGLIP
jgi:DNA-binding NtrC family response regulator